VADGDLRLDIVRMTGSGLQAKQVHHGRSRRVR
jgi:hypothetical protein